MKKRFPFREGEILKPEEWKKYIKGGDTNFREERPEEGLIYHWEAVPQFSKNASVEKYVIHAYKEPMPIAALALYEMSKERGVNKVVQNEIDRLRDEIESLSSACRNYRDLIAHQTIVLSEAVHAQEDMKKKMTKMRDAYEEEIEELKSLREENEMLIKEMNKFAAQNGLIVVNDPETGQMSLVKEKKKAWFRAFT